MPDEKSIETQKHKKAYVKEAIFYRLLNTIIVLFARFILTRRMESSDYYTDLLYLPFFENPYKCRAMTLRCSELRCHGCSACEPNAFGGSAVEFLR